MRLTLGTNLSSLHAQGELRKSTNQLSTVYERLSSGLRINRASDDPAGLAVAQSLQSDARVFGVALRNLNDGISLFNIADSAVENLSSIVLRLQELAQQSANGTYSQSQRLALDAEAQALSQEFSRIARSTEFNGRELFTGDLNGLSIQAGIGANGAILTGVGGAIGTGSYSAAFTAGDAVAEGSIRSADLNGDGNLDLITSGGTYVSALLGTGGGSFGAEQTYAATAGEFALADFNNDGHYDVVTAAGNVLLGNGSGGFGAAADFSSDSGSVATADFNGDGNMDFAIGGATSFKIVLGNGNGTFQAEINTASSSGTQHLEVADFNNDGRLDLIYNNSTINRHFFRLGNGDGTFGAETNITTGSPNILGLALGDFNGDGKVDIASTTATNYFQVWLGNGNGTFGAAASIAAPTVASSALTAADLDGDGVLDLLVEGYAQNIVGRYTGNGSGGFTLTQNLTMVAASAGFSPLNRFEVRDFNRDGVVDIAAIGFQGVISMLRGGTTDGIADIQSFSLRTAVEAKQASSLFTVKAELLSKQRGVLGSFESRLGIAADVVSVTAANYSAAAARIIDADVAQEVAEMVRLQILQKAAAAVLAQANQQPQTVLKLLES